ncbi:unnamed protein product [Linum tenue]|uniref:Uncharacterized protein n=1 Tax=Linum tenue TaxID=586396 RepID=A0AAV0KBE3_9ROSI|nr:unnamed protein product [Linum tenue]
MRAVEEELGELLEETQNQLNEAEKRSGAEATIGTGREKPRRAVGGMKGWVLVYGRVVTELVNRLGSYG